MKTGANKRNNIDPRLAEIDSNLLKQTFEALIPEGEALCVRFYERLFDQYPEVKPLFEKSDMAKQSKKLLSALSLVVSSFVKKELPIDALKQLGERHQTYGAVEGHYQAVAEVLLGVMQEFSGQIWTNEVEKVWRDALNIVATTMISAYSITEGSSMESTKQTVQVEMESKDVENNDTQHMQSAVDNAMTAIMMVDLDLIITYANKATISLLKKHADALNALYSGFSADNIVGTCID
ncbi:MAG: methyl-accepting chemotaxis protein, partial [Gammaproteobacteria bacterium]|nr:methyl-accepting chemotaxis protein [Gammaproteobacteria bacterium]